MSESIDSNKMEPPIPVKLPFDERLKSKKKQKICDFAAFWLVFNKNLSIL